MKSANYLIKLQALTDKVQYPKDKGSVIHRSLVLAFHVGYSTFTKFISADSSLISYRDVIRLPKVVTCIHKYYTNGITLEKKV